MSHFSNHLEVNLDLFFYALLHPRYWRQVPMRWRELMRSIRGR